MAIEILFTLEEETMKGFIPAKLHIEKSKKSYALILRREFPNYCDKRLYGEYQFVFKSKEQIAELMNALKSILEEKK